MTFIFIVMAPLGISFFIAFIMTPFARKLAIKTNALDVPKDDRRMHTKPMPLLGGISIFVATTIAVLLVKFLFLPLVINYLEIHNIEYNRTEIIMGIQKLNTVLIGGVLIFGVGLLDDYNGMKPLIKFLCQIVCAAGMFVMGIRVDLIWGHNFGQGSTMGMIMSCLVTIVWIVGITNTINLIDGLDGLAAGVAAIASIAIAYTAYIHGMYTVTLAMLALAGASLGFLPYNFDPAKIFMGDSGSLYLGFVLATISIIGPVKSATVVATIVPALVLGVPIFDVAFAILRRYINKKPIMVADKAHLHHRMIASGMGVKRSVLMLYGISGIMGIAAIILSRDYLFESVGLFVIAVLFIILLIWGWNDPDEKG